MTVPSPESILEPSRAILGHVSRSPPNHPDHRDMKEWIGGKFDPEKFSVDAVNKELRRV